MHKEHSLGGQHCGPRGWSAMAVSMCWDAALLVVGASSCAPCTWRTCLLYHAAAGVVGRSVWYLQSLLVGPAAGLGLEPDPGDQGTMGDRKNMLGASIPSGSGLDL